MLHYYFQSFLHFRLWDVIQILFEILKYLCQNFRWEVLQKVKTLAETAETETSNAQMPKSKVIGMTTTTYIRGTVAYAVNFAMSRTKVLVLNSMLCLSV